FIDSSFFPRRLSTRALAQAARRESPTPPFDHQNAAKADGVGTTAALAVFSDTKKLHQHLRCFGGVTVAELDHVVTAAFQQPSPVRWTGEIFNSFRARR